jgi:small subunit ribosomal protein S6
LAETVYEGMFLLDSNRYGRDPEGVAGQVPQMIREAGGEVLVSRLWEERRLAYSIKGRRKGTYWLTYFRMHGGKLVDLRRRSQLNGNVLRALFLKVDPRIVDTLVEHAQAGQVKSVGKPGQAKTAKAGGGPSGKADKPEKPEKPEKKETPSGKEEKESAGKQAGAVAAADAPDQPAAKEKAD